MKISVKVEQEFIVEFDETNEDFIGVYENYQEFIDNDGDYEDLAKYVVHNVCAGNAQGSDIDGIGLIKIDNNYQRDYSNRECPVIEHPIHCYSPYTSLDFMDYDMESEIIETYD